MRRVAKHGQRWSVVGLGVLMVGVSVTLVYSQPQSAQPPASTPPSAPVMPLNAVGNFPARPISFEKTDESLPERLSRQITLDVREMNIIDVLKFLALKGDFNMVTNASVTGRVTLFLKNVSIQDALDIIVIANGVAYYTENDIMHVMAEAEYQTRFGKKFNDKNKVHIIQLKYAKPSYVLSALDSVKSSMGKIVIDEDTGSVVLIDTPQSIERMLGIVAEIESPLEAVVYSLQFAKADVVAEKLKARVDSNAVGSITVDERTNKLIVRAFPGRRAEVEGLLKDLDAPTKEVLVEARVMQIVFKPQFDFGIDWTLAFKDSADRHLRKLTFKNVNLNESNLTTSSNLGSKFGKISWGSFTNDNFETAVRALKQVSDTKILSNPKLLVTNNQEAKIHVGDTIPYIISTTSGTGDNAITSEDVRFVDVGIKLSVTPTINDDGFVTMNLKPEISTVVTRISSKGGGIPQINKTEVETTAMVKDGMTIILGGLKKENKTQTTAGVPLLMDVPFLRRIFGATSDTIEYTEIVILITPHIISGQEDYDRFRGEIKSAQEYSKQMEKQKSNALTIKD